MVQPPKLIAGVLGLGAFVAACIAGIASAADPIDTLWRALTALLFCSVLGAILGRIGMVAVDEYIAQHLENNPVPGDDLSPAQPAPDAAGEPEPADVDSPEPDQAAPPAQAA